MAGIFYRHNGDVVPAAIAFDGASGNTSSPSLGIEGNRLTVGTVPPVGVRTYGNRGELLIGLLIRQAEFTGDDVGSLTRSPTSHSFNHCYVGSSVTLH